LILALVESNTRKPHAGAKRNWELYGLPQFDWLQEESRVRGGTHANPAGLSHLAKRRSEEMVGKPGVGGVLFSFAELSQLSSYSPFRFFHPLFGNQSRRRCARRKSECRAYFCKLRMYWTIIFN
jgi:hypothetical protein